MKKKVLKKAKVQWNLENQEDFWKHYNQLSLTYKAIELNNWKKTLSSTYNSETVSLALARCAEEERILTELKAAQDKKSDELLTKDSKVLRK